MMLKPKQCVNLLKLIGQLCIELIVTHLLIFGLISTVLVANGYVFTIQNHNHVTTCNVSLMFTENEISVAYHPPNQLITKSKIAPQYTEKILSFHVISQSNSEPVIKLNCKDQTYEFPLPQIALMILSDPEHNTYIERSKTDTILIVAQQQAEIASVGLYNRERCNITAYHPVIVGVTMNILSDNEIYPHLISTADNDGLSGIGKNFNQRILDYFINLFEKKNNIDVSNNEHTKRILMVEIEKARRKLLFVDQTRIEIEDFVDGIDFSEMLTRTRFDESNKDLFEQKEIVSIDRLGEMSKLQTLTDQQINIIVTEQMLCDPFVSEMDRCCDIMQITENFKLKVNELSQVDRSENEYIEAETVNSRLNGKYAMFGMNDKTEIFIMLDNSKETMVILIKIQRNIDEILK